MKSSIVIVTVSAVLLFAQPSRLSAQQRNPVNQAELIQTLLTRIDQLEKRVSELEGSKPQAAAPARAEEPHAPADLTHSEGTQPATDAPNLHIAGFSDINFSGSDQPGSKSGF